MRPNRSRAIDAVFEKAFPGTGWGMTETNAIGVGIAAADYLRKPESSGRVSAVLDIRVVDENNKPVPTGQRGELQIRGASIMRGLLQQRGKPTPKTSSTETGSRQATSPSSTRKVSSSSSTASRIS